MIQQDRRRPLLLAAVLLAVSVVASSCGLAADTGDVVADSFRSLGGDEEDAGTEVVVDAADADTTSSTESPATEPTQLPAPAEAATEPASGPASEPTELPATEPTPPPATAEPTPPPPTPTPEPTPIVINGCAVEPTATPDPARPQYDANMSVDVSNRSVSGDVQVEFTPDLPIDSVIVRLWPNSPRLAASGTKVTVADVTIDGADAAAEQTSPTMLEIDLDATVEAGQTVTVAMAFELVVGGEQRGRVAAGPDFLRLGSILPTLPWQPGHGWATDPATALFAEAALSPSADYRVRIDVPDGYDVLASGQPDDAGVWAVEAARDFALSVGKFTTVERTAMATNDVVVTVGMHSTLVDDPQAYLDKIVDALEMFSRLWGDYPWPSLSVAITPGIGGGIEFPTHIMQGQGTLGRTTSHEIGHMFFYSLVGNNQGRSPWLDEGLASYAEFRYENFNTNVVGIPASALGESGQPMSYFADHRGTYYNSVYLYPGVAIGDLGDTADIDCALRRYVAANAFGIAEPADFFDAFDDIFPNVTEAFAPYGLTPELD